MNTKHEVHNFDKCIAQLKTSMKVIKHMTECQERGKKEKLYCDKLSFSCKPKKNLKAHD